MTFTCWNPKCRRVIVAPDAPPADWANPADAHTSCSSCGVRYSIRIEATPGKAPVRPLRGHDFPDKVNKP